MSNIIIPKAQPLFPKVIQPDSPMMSAYETQMALQTTALWYKGQTDYKSWFWENPPGAPNLTLSFSTGYTDKPFIVPLGSTAGAGDIEAQVPWFYPATAARIKARALVAHNSSATAYFDLRAYRLLAADTQSAAVGVRSESLDRLQHKRPIEGSWVQYGPKDGYGYNAFTYVTCSVTPNITNTRRIMLTLRATWAGESVPDGATTHNMFLVGLELWNEHTTPTP